MKWDGKIRLTGNPAPKKDGILRMIKTKIYPIKLIKDHGK